MKSALTAALSGANPVPSKINADTNNSAVDAFSFPCLTDKADPKVEDIAAGVERIDLARASLPSSAPTASRRTDAFVADYDLHPYKLRGGREGMPSSFKESQAAANYITEAVIGSLPRAMSLTEKELVFANTPLSPTLNLLNSMPSNLVSSRSMEGKRLRRHVLRGAVIVFVTAGYSGKRFIFEKAKELGVRTVIIDGPDSWSKELVKEGVVEKFIPLDMSDAETVFDRCLAAIQKVKKEMGELDGVCSFCEIAMPLVTRLAEKLGVPGNSPEAVDNARDKHATRTKMAECGLPTPKNYLIESPDELQKASDAVGYPAVIKPIYGAASIGVVRVDNFEELQRCYAKVTKELRNAKVVAGALEQGSDNDDDEGGDQGNASSWIRTTIMMEEYLDGPEVDVDLVFSEGVPVYGAVTDNWPTVEPYFNETGSNAPCILPKYQQRELMDLAVASVQALGFRMGVFHVECKYTSRGARLIEVNCRMGGGPVRNMNLLVWGVDLVEEQLLCTAGIPCRPPVAAKPLVNIAEFSVNAMQTGILKDVSFLDQYQKDPDVLYARALVEAGQKVVCVNDGLPTWVCELMVTKPSVDEAIATVKKMEEEIQKAMVIES